MNDFQNEAKDAYSSNDNVYKRAESLHDFENLDLQGMIRLFCLKNSLPFFVFSLF